MSRMPGESRKSRAYRRCTACRQYIVPGEMYITEVLTPWGGGDGRYAHWPFCRWCGNHLYDYLEVDPYEGYDETDLQNAAWEMCRDWLNRLEKEGLIERPPGEWKWWQDRWEEILHEIDEIIDRETKEVCKS